MAEPTDDVVRQHIVELLPTVDLETMGLKKFIRLLSSRLGGLSLQHRKDFIKEALTEVLASQQQEQEDEEEAAEDDDDDEGSDDDDDQGGSSDEDDRGRPKATAKTTKRKKGGGGLSAKLELSPALRDFLGRGTHLARTEVVKALWEYIREHDLQNPSNRKEIVLDARMRDVFGCDTFTMFSMNKYIGAHVHPFKPVDLSSPTSASSSSTGRRRTTTSSSKPTRKRRAGGGGGSSATKTTRKKGSQPPYRLSPALAAVTGTDVLPRPQVVSKVWEYIRTHDLQNPENRREILCDETLRKVMGNKTKISMFKMNTHLSDHLVERVDRSLYRHDDEDDADDE